MIRFFASVVVASLLACGQSPSGGPIPSSPPQSTVDGGAADADAGAAADAGAGTLADAGGPANIDAGGDAGSDAGRAFTAATLLSSGAGSYDGYTTAIYEIRYTHKTTSAKTFMRLNTPAALPSSGEVGVVLFVAGAHGAGVAANEDAQHAAIASGKQLPAPFSERATPMFSVSYNNPGNGADPYAATGDPDMPATPANPTGDDYCGPMSVAALTAALDAALVEIARAHPGLTPKLLVQSFSNGAACASQFVAGPNRFRVHAYVEGEGPTDGLEQSVTTECFDLLGVGTSPALARSFDIASWANCAGTDRRKFLVGWRYYHRPPLDIVRLMQAVVATSGEPTGGFPAPDGERVRAADLADIVTYWEARAAGTYLARRRSPYIRVNSRDDHVQPDHYKNRHALRALFAAASVDARNVYFVDTAGRAPRAFDAGAFDLDDWETYPVWPDLNGVGKPKRPDVEVDALRWAYRQAF